MNKTELIKHIAEKLKVTQSSSSEILNALFEELPELLLRHGVVQIPGFASFKLKERKSRKGRNPRTGEVITIPASKYVSFSVGSKFKAAVNKKKKK